nr:zinc finger, CCHC-type [Tanacetum cinerariifolium]
MKAGEKATLMKKAYGTSILRLEDRVLREVTKETTAAAEIWTKLTSLYMTKRESLTMEDVLATLNSRELEKRTEGTKEVTSDELYVKGRSDYSGKVHSDESSRFKSRGRNGKLKSFICHSKGHLKRDCLIKKSNGFVKKGKHDQDFDSSDDEGNAYFGEDLVVVENDEMTELVTDSGGSYHMTHKRDFLYDFKVIDDGSVQLKDVKYVPRLRRSLISLGTLEKEGCTLKMQMGRIKVIKGLRFMKTGIKKKNSVYSLEEKQLGVKQVGFKQLGPGVKTVVHGVQVDKRVWFEVEVHGAQGNRETEVFHVSNDDAAVAQRWLEDKQVKEKTSMNCLVKEQEKVHLSIKVGASIMVTGVSGKEDAEGNVAKKKKVKESMEANLGKLLKSHADGYYNDVNEDNCDIQPLVWLQGDGELEVVKDGVVSSVTVGYGNTHKDLNDDPVAMEVQSPSVNLTNAVKTCGGSYPPLPTRGTTPAENTPRKSSVLMLLVNRVRRSSYATIMIELQADVEVKDNIVVDMPKINEEWYYTCNVECPKNPDLCAGAGETKKKKHSQSPKGILVGPKMAFKPNQEYRHVPKKNTLNSSGNKKICVDSTNKNVDNNSTVTTPILDKIRKFKNIVIDGKAILVDEAGNPVEKVKHPDDHDSENEIALVDNDMARSLASERTDLALKDLFEEIQTICDKLDILVRGDGDDEDGDCDYAPAASKEDGDDDDGDYDYAPAA